MCERNTKRFLSAGRKGGLLAAVVVVAAACGSDHRDDDIVSTTHALTGSLFETTDGDLVHATGFLDWDNAPDLVSQQDLPSGTGDNAFGQGTKEDNASVTVVTGSIPPNKSDLTHFYISHQNLNGSFFLYLAWERANVLGNANMDFEFNQLATPGFNSATVGAVTINRSPGDLLVTYDFSGSGTPALGLLTWATGATTPKPPSGQASNVCFSGSSFPCWANRVDLTTAGFADGAVNSVTVFDPILGISLIANEFGEAGINLTAAGVFPPGQCVNFASVFLKSRSSSSFTAELKDFVAPATANITNCGQINIQKRDQNGNPLGPATFQLFSGSPSSTDPTKCSGAAISPPFTCTADLGTGNCSMSDVPFGTYCVAETSGPPNFFTPNAQTATISNSTPTITLTFVDLPKPGAIALTKTDSKGRPLQGASFTVSKNGSVVAGPLTTDASGHICFTGLSIGTTYQVAETAAPTGYSFDATAKDVTVSQASADCTVAPATVSFTDIPLSTIAVSFTSQAGPGVTTATIQCTGESGFTSLTSHTLSNLVPGTYSCTVVIDP
jgi:hypothetical protein